MKLSRSVTYALQATLQLAGAESADPIPCSRLAAVGQMPERFLLQILRNLVSHGILVSTRGVDGGYTLARAPEAISLLEIVEAIDGLWVTVVPPGPGLPELARMRLEKGLAELTATLRDGLGRITLADLLPAPTRCAGPLPDAHPIDLAHRPRE
jgi:Rrf2 family protein